ncbi:MAG: TRAP transporter substrate-binding protein DctP [Lachnospiraceae bacterium]|nr:TRAP transporter substrate-binding protein DctP [Lachnospiraceae bacterium]
MIVATGYNRAQNKSKLFKTKEENNMKKISRRDFMKGVGATVLAASAMGALSGCGGDSGQSGTKGSAAAGSDASSGSKSGSGNPTYKFRMASAAAADMYPNVAMQMACDEIYEKTNGDVEITLYADNLLGDYTTCFEDLMKGTIDFSMFSTPTDYDEKLGVVSLPYMITSWDQYEKVCFKGGSLYNRMEELLAEHNIKFLGFCTEGLQGLGMTGCTKLESVVDPDVRKEELMRVPPLESYAKLADLMGFNYVSLPYADLYSALQSGVCDGWYGGAATINYTAYRDIIKVWVDARTSSELMCINVNMDLWNSLPEDYQKIIADAFYSSSMFSFESAEQYEDENKQLLKDYGIEIYVPSEEDLAKVSAKVREELWPELKKMYGEEAVDKILADLEA